MAQVKEVKGPGGPRGMGPKPKVENPGKLLKRIMMKCSATTCPLHPCAYLHRGQCAGQCAGQPVFADFDGRLYRAHDPPAEPQLCTAAGALLRVGCIYLVGILAAWINARVMVNVTQGTLRNLRTELFTHMESLPSPI